VSDTTDVQHRRAVESAWEEYADGRRISAVEELSAMVSTNRVYRLTLSDHSSVIAKSSNYGSFFLFAEDHDRLHRTERLLEGGPYEHFMAATLTADGRPYVWYDGTIWVALYHEVEVRDRLPNILSVDQVKNFGEEVARFHRATAAVARLVPPTSKTVTSDAIALYDITAHRRAGEELGLDPSRVDLVRRHTHRFLMAVHESGYDYWPKQPVLIDWNLGNFSVDLADDGSFTFFSRWDYDWFRYETRLLDFYFLSRVSSRTGDRSTFTYGAHTLFEPRFRTFLRAYHRVFPLSAEEVLFLKEAYRFFLLNYVVREGQYFFRHDIWRQLLVDVVDRHLPQLDELDFSRLLPELGLVPSN
jgi:hypothetical protein